MIVSRKIDGGGYGDCLPRKAGQTIGQYAVPVSKYLVATSEGMLATIYDPRYLSLSPDGHAWAAQCGADPNLPPDAKLAGGVQYFVAQKRWEKIKDASGNDAVVGGINPVIYDNLNDLYVHPVGPGMPVEGYRFVDAQNRLVEAIDTQAPSPKAPRITQWVDLSRDGHTLIVGQGDRMGATVFLDGTYYSLTDPANTDRLPVDAFVVDVGGRIDGEELAFTAHLQLVGWTTLLWMDLDDIASLPLYPSANAERPVPDALPPDVASVALTGFWVADAAAPGNTAVGGLTHPLVIAGEAEILRAEPERRLGLLVYLEGDDALATTRLQQARAFALEHDLTCVVYDDRRRFRYGLVKEHLAGVRKVLSPQWYLRANATLLAEGETPAAFAQDVIAQAKTFDGCPLTPTIRATFGGWQIPAADVVEALNELVRQGALRLPGFAGWLFWAWNRKDGVNAASLVDDNGKPFPVPAFRPAVDLWMRTRTTITNARGFADAFFTRPLTAAKVTITDYQVAGDGTAPATVVVWCETSAVVADATVDLLMDGAVVKSTPWDGQSATLSFQHEEPGEYRLTARLTVAGRIVDETGAVRLVRVLQAPPVPPSPVKTGREGYTQAADEARNEGEKR